jgi:subtilisin family serine protease
MLAGALLVYPGQSGGSRAAAPGPPPAPARPRVAVIDSGIARTAELGAWLVAEFDMAAHPARPPFRPADDHGTMVATILAREAEQPLEIVSLRIDDPAGCPAGASPPCQHDARPVASAIRKAAELRVSAINISLHLADDPLITEAVRAAARQGIKVVLAAGNQGREQPGNLEMARAGFPNAILVGACDRQGQPWRGTNRPHPGTPGYLYVWQLGVAVPTALADGTKVAATGTSFAAPIETARLLGSAGVVRPDHPI